jgi:CoA:oxalate CoA-transferase
MDRLGIGWSALSGVNPALVMLSISGYGQAGVASHRPSYAPVMHAETGLIGRQAQFDGGPGTDPMLSIADTNTALHGMVAVFAALRMRDSTGVGQHIDMAMINAQVATDDYAHHALDGAPIQRLGGQVLATADGGRVLVSGEARYVWKLLTTHEGVTDPTPPGASLDEKITCRADAMRAWASRYPDRDTLVARLDELALPWGDIVEPQDVFDSDVARERRLAVEVDDRAGGTRRVVDSPYRFSAATSGPAAGAPHRGEHNANVLAEWLDYDAAQIDELAAAGVLLADVPG